MVKRFGMEEELVWVCQTSLERKMQILFVPIGILCKCKGQFLGRWDLTSKEAMLSTSLEYVNRTTISNRI